MLKLLIFQFHKQNFSGGDAAFKKGGGKEHYSEHTGSHGEKSDKGYKGHHHHEKGEKGHHTKEDHKKHYDEKEGDAKKHYHEDGYHAEKTHGEKGHKNSKVMLVTVKYDLIYATS